MPLSLALFRWFFFRSLFQVFKSLIFLTTSSLMAAILMTFLVSFNSRNVHISKMGSIVHMCNNVKSMKL